jgi:hypothetical protein
VRKLYTADQMQAYARAALAAQGVPVGWKLAGYLYDFKDNGATIPDWFTVRKAEAEAPGHFNVRDCYTPAPVQAQQAAPLYEELLFAVGNKHPDETRHQTALRYIRQAEAAGIGASSGSAA